MVPLQGFLSPPQSFLGAGTVWERAALEPTQAPHRPGEGIRVPSASDGHRGLKHREARPSPCDRHLLRPGLWTQRCAEIPPHTAKSDLSLFFRVPGQQRTLQMEPWSHLGFFSTAISPPSHQDSRWGYQCGRQRRSPLNHCRRRPPAKLSRTNATRRKPSPVQNMPGRGQ